MKYRIAVRALCEFTAKCGDLDLRFTPAPSAQEGQAGHQTVQRRRPAGYRAELKLEGEYEDLLVRGRADGYDPALRRLEEIKTYRGRLEQIPDNHRQLHWAQARIYGWLLCQQEQLDSIELALVYYEIGSQTETVLTEQYPAQALQHYFSLQCQTFLAWARQELLHRSDLDTALAQLKFPHPQFRPGQRELAEAAFRAVRQGCAVMIQAPTGIGKTIGTIFPLLKAKPAHGLDKIFFLTAKTSGRQLALHALATLNQTDPKVPLRVLELTARDKSCEHPDKACHGASCPLAAGFYNKLPAARLALLEQPVFDRHTLRSRALEHQVCPYYLGQEMLRWADVCVGDYNYYFDSSALLWSMSRDYEWRVALLIDEAHNLIERARSMYSCRLWQGDLAALRKTAAGPLRRALDRLNRAWNALTSGQSDAVQQYTQIAPEFLDTLRLVSANLADHLVGQDAAPDPALQSFYFDLLGFAYLAEQFDSHSVFEVTRRGKGQNLLEIINLIPAPFLKPRFAATHASVLFSATLAPWQFYLDMLGLPEHTPWIDVPSPFDPDQLEVDITTEISTRWRDRTSSILPLAERIAAQYQRRPGNYLAFFSSFDYLDQVADQLLTLEPGLPVWRQSRSMDETAREQFLARFTPDGKGIGFAVLGGAFGEAIDLPGERLIGAFIATLGMPQVNRHNEQLRRSMQERFGAGYAYAYLFPGLQKVVQAAGRVIRGPDDRGMVLLMDQRYLDPDVRALLPAWWHIRA